MFRLFSSRNQPQNQVVCPPKPVTTLDARTRQSLAHQYAETVRTQVYRRVYEGVPLEFTVSDITSTSVRVYLFPQGTPKYATLQFSTPANFGNEHIELGLGSAVDTVIHGLTPNTLYVYQVTTTYSFSGNPNSPLRTYTEARVRQFRTHGPPTWTHVSPGPFDGILRWTAPQVNPGDTLRYLVVLSGEMQFDISSIRSLVNMNTRRDIPPGIYVVTVTAIYGDTVSGAETEYTSDPRTVDYLGT